MITAEDTKHALLAYVTIEDGYQRLQKVVLNDDSLTYTEKGKYLTHLQLVYESLNANEKAV